VPGCRKELRCGGSQLTAYSRQQRAAECHFREARLEAAARIARTPVLPELLAVMRDEVNEHRSCAGALMGRVFQGLAMVICELVCARVHVCVCVRVCARVFAYECV